MRRLATTFGLAVLILTFATGCDSGERAGVPEGAIYRVEVEREVSFGPNPSLVVFAKGFDKSGDILSFACPCHVGENVFGNVSIYESVVSVDQLEFALIPNAPYNIREEELNLDTIE